MNARDRAHRVVIVGGGFGGLQAALKLRRAHVEITLIDDPLRAVFKHNRNVRVLLAEVARFGLAQADEDAAKTQSNAGDAFRHPFRYAP